MKLQQLMSVYKIVRHQYSSASKLTHVSDAAERIHLIRRRHANAPRRSLDLGCGSTPNNTFGAREVFGLDIVDAKIVNFKTVDLVADPIPFGDAEFDCVTAHDFIEHVPRVIYNPGRKFPFVDLMSEIHRVLTPFYPMCEAFVDPTHVNTISAETFEIYFCGSAYGRNYGFRGHFVTVDNFINGAHLWTILKKGS
jgi:SAM-dependent methyltransferase